MSTDGILRASRKSYRRFERPIVAQRIKLTDDDVEVLRRVFAYRFIRADDLYRLFPTRSQDRLSRRLTHLYRNGFLDRPIAQVDRFREGGSKALVYGLDAAGARHLADWVGASVGSGNWKARNRAYTRENLDHTLATARFLVDLELACGTRGDLSFVPFDRILDDAPEHTRALARPGQWPVAVAWHGHSASVQVAPDAIVGLRAMHPGGQVRRSFLFVEIDRGTMTIVPARQVREREVFLYRATILRKLLTYAESYRQGLHQEHLGVPTARVLLLTSSEARARAMQQAADQFIVSTGRVPPGLFLFGVLDAGSDPLQATLMDGLGNPASLIPAVSTGA